MPRYTSRARPPHTCIVCQSRLLFFFPGPVHCPQKGWYEYIAHHQSSTANEDGFWFNLQYAQAVKQARRGCELMKWLVTLRRPDTWSGSRLRAYFTHNSWEQMAVDWVDDISDYTDSLDFDRKLILCADSR